METLSDNTEDIDQKSIPSARATSGDKLKTTASPNAGLSTTSNENVCSNETINLSPLRSTSKGEPNISDGVRKENIFYLAETDRRNVSSSSNTANIEKISSIDITNLHSSQKESVQLGTHCDGPILSQTESTISASLYEKKKEQNDPEQTNSTQTDTISSSNSNKKSLETEQIEPNVAKLNEEQGLSNRNDRKCVQTGATPSDKTAQNELNITVESSSVFPDSSGPNVLPSCSTSQHSTTNLAQTNQTKAKESVETGEAPSSTCSQQNFTNTLEIPVQDDSMMSDGDCLLVEQCSKITNGIDPARLEIDSFHLPKVNLYAEDKGPKWYDVSESLISKPLIPSKLSEAFSSLPIFGRPKDKSELPQFQNKKIKEFVGCDLDDAAFEKLAEYCSADNLRTGEELVMLNSPGQGFYPSEIERLTKNTSDQSPELNIIRKHKLRVEKDTKNLYCKRFKYRGIRMITHNNDDEDNTPVVTLGTPPVTPGRDLLFVVRWYRPFTYNPKDRYQSRSRPAVFSCSCVLLGRQRLSALRDRLVCANDVDMRLDVATRPDHLPASSAKEMFPSGFLFINNVFYVDTRAGCVDYTAPLRRWAAARGLGEFPSRDMCDVRLDELVLRLGHPEVYVHQGSCEHPFTFSELRLAGAGDPLRLAAYPRAAALSQHQTVYCTTCAEFGARWIVVGCPRVPFDPAFFCEKCFKLYLYKDGKPIGNFKAYLYRGNEINLLKPQG